LMKIMPSILVFGLISINCCHGVDTSTSDGYSQATIPILVQLFHVGAERGMW
jgi:hypothetical protein